MKTVIINIAQKCPTLNIITLTEMAEHLIEETNNKVTFINVNKEDKLFSNFDFDVIDFYANRKIINFAQVIHHIIHTKNNFICINSGELEDNLFLKYIGSCDITNELKRNNIQLILVTSITGGLFTKQSLKDFYLISQLQDANVVPILDERLYSANLGDKEFYETKAYKQVKENRNILGEIYLPKIKPHVMKSYIEQINSKKLFDPIKRQDASTSCLFSFLKAKDDFCISFQQAFFANKQMPSTTIRHQKDIVEQRLADLASIGF